MSRSKASGVPSPAAAVTTLSSITLRRHVNSKMKVIQGSRAYFSHNWDMSISNSSLVPDILLRFAGGVWEASVAFKFIYSERIHGGYSLCCASEEWVNDIAKIWWNNTHSPPDADCMYCEWQGTALRWSRICDKVLETETRTHMYNYYERNTDRVVNIKSRTCA